MVAQHRDDGAGVVGGDRLAEGEVRREYLRALLEPRLALQQELPEDALALLELLVDRLARDLRVGLDHEEGAQPLHQHQQHHEEHHQAARPGS